MAKFGFNAAEVDVNAQGSFDPMPPGEYVLKAIEAEEKSTAAGTGSYIAVTFEVVEGNFKGRRVWNNYNTNNPSEKAQSIGRQQLVSWATAAGKPDADDTDKLLGRPFNCMLDIEKGTGGYSDRNRIKSYVFPTSSAAKPAASKPAKPAAPAAKSANPWD